MKTKWIKHGGYHEEHQFIDGTGKIVGSVSGSRFEREEGWTAWDDSVHPAKWLGRYTTPEAAKLAVERTRMKPRKKTETK